MPVTTSPRLRDSLDYEEPEATDLRFGFRSLTVDSTEYEHHEPQDDHRAFAGFPDPSAGRRKRQQRRSDMTLDHAVPFQYPTVADGDAFRLVVVRPGTSSAPVECHLLWESSSKPTKEYRCLSYCWETAVRDAAILCNGFRMPVTRNLLIAMQSLRKPTTDLLIWIDQICINQDDLEERSHQVSIMKYIFSQAKEVVVWLGEEDDRSEKVCEYAKKMHRGDDSPKSTWTHKSTMKRIMSQSQLQNAIQSLLQRPWFQRVWVIPEVALAHFTVVVCGKSVISWDNLVRLIRDSHLPQTQGFDKQTALLGNPRQRIAILTQMTASQRRGLMHTDITQLLILAKSSQATDYHDKVYAFYGMTLLSTVPDYTRPEEQLFVDIAHQYINAILYDDYYSKFHALNEQRRSQQIMSILYSAGMLHQHQHYGLPSWVPDWTYAWHQAPLWCKTESNIVVGSGKDEWSAGIRCEYRAGGDEFQTFEVLDDSREMHQLLLSALLFDRISNVGHTASTVELSPEGNTSPTILDSPTLSYGRSFFQTDKGTVGIATHGIQKGDVLAILLGGDVPVVLRSASVHRAGEPEVYELLCECYVQSSKVMDGNLIRTQRALANDIVLM
ncbi:hypothetical protein LTR08_008686 [Meristemomyces frigidus]|nr:hypothetical protein LTR08_008686 [Meristemomyces frigidus]